MRSRIAARGCVPGGTRRSRQRASTTVRVSARKAASRDGRISTYIHEGYELTSRPDAYFVAGTKNSSHLYRFSTHRYLNLNMFAVDSYFTPT